MAHNQGRKVENETIGEKTVLMPDLSISAHKFQHTNPNCLNDVHMYLQYLYIYIHKIASIKPTYPAKATHKHKECGFDASLSGLVLDNDLTLHDSVVWFS